AVIPPKQYGLVCSNEFEIIRPKNGLNPYVLCHILRTDIVQNQIVNLTSGTSSSHNRIKTEQLANIQISMTSDDKELEKLGEKLKKSTDSIYKAERVIKDALSNLEV
ncbi:MAG: hypothetical protein II169_08660, partial [Lachnospiraceae bacterium]|nr:hypothetical protein [Lachnospiraceae bacterium]